MKSEQASNIPSNAFMSVLQGHANGAACQELSEGMQECIEAVNATGKPAVMTMKIKFTPASRGGAVIVAAEVATKLPAGDSPTSIWFADEDCRLHREDPRQANLPIRSLENPPEKEIRTINS